MFLCTDLFWSTQYGDNKGPNPLLTTAGLMTQHYPADPKINFSFFNHPAHARHCDNRQLGKHGEVFLRFWCLVSFRSCLIKVRWLVMCGNTRELLILRIVFTYGGNEKCRKHDCFCNTGLLFIITNHSVRSFIDHLTRPQWEAVVLLSLHESTDSISQLLRPLHCLTWGLGPVNSNTW